jgi:hypothetical protein
MIRELPTQGPALPGHYPFLAYPILPISYPLPAGSQITRGKTEIGVSITRARPIWVTTILVHAWYKRTQKKEESQVPNPITAREGKSSKGRGFQIVLSRNLA